MHLGERSQVPPGRWDVLIPEGRRTAPAASLESPLPGEPPPPPREPPPRRESLLRPWPWAPGPPSGFTCVLCSPAVPPLQGQEAGLLLVRGQVRAAPSRLRRPGERRHSLLQHGQQVDAARHVSGGAWARGPRRCVSGSGDRPRRRVQGPPPDPPAAAQGTGPVVRLSQRCLETLGRSWTWTCARSHTRIRRSPTPSLPRTAAVAYLHRQAVLTLEDL